MRSWVLRLVVCSVGEGLVVRETKCAPRFQGHDLVGRGNSRNAAGGMQRRSRRRRHDHESLFVLSHLRPFVRVRACVFVSVIQCVRLRATPPQPAGRHPFCMRKRRRAP